MSWFVTALSSYPDKSPHTVKVHVNKTNNTFHSLRCWLFTDSLHVRL